MMRVGVVGGHCQLLEALRNSMLRAARIGGEALVVSRQKRWKRLSLIVQDEVWKIPRDIAFRDALCAALSPERRCRGGRRRTDLKWGGLG